MATFDGLPALLRKRRSELGLGQVDIARVCGVTQGVVSDWERGVCFPALPRLLLLARHLGIDTGDLDALLNGGNGEAAA